MTINMICLIIQWLLLGWMLRITYNTHKKNKQFTGWVDKFIELNYKAGDALKNDDTELYIKTIREMRKHWDEMEGI